MNTPSKEYVVAVATSVYAVLHAYETGLGGKPAAAFAELSTERRDSLTHGVRCVLEGDVLNAQQSHQAWCVYHEQRGWSYAKEKDEAKKLHPCMTSWEKLSALDRMKDYLFVGAVLAAQTAFMAGTLAKEVTA